MKAKRVWIEYEDTDGKSYMLPATIEDIRRLQAQDETTLKDLETASAHLDRVRQF